MALIMVGTSVAVTPTSELALLQLYCIFSAKLSALLKTHSVACVGSTILLNQSATLISLVGFRVLPSGSGLCDLSQPQCHHCLIILRSHRYQPV